MKEIRFSSFASNKREIPDIKPFINALGLNLFVSSFFVKSSRLQVLWIVNFFIKLQPHGSTLKVFKNIFRSVFQCWARLYVLLELDGVVVKALAS